ncbi:MAG: hypothetical protein ACRC3H_03665 [Lachnospiraceae bacterium]
MSENNFITSTQKSNKQNFSGRFKLLLMLAILLTSPSILGLLGFTGELLSSWTEFGTASFSMLVYLLCELCIFISLIRIFINKKPFLKIIAQCVWIISILLLVSSLIFTRLPDYKLRGFEIFSNTDGSFVLIDGHFFLSGILAAILACLIKEGVKMQTELDEIL